MILAPAVAIVTVIVSLLTPPIPSKYVSGSHEKIHRLRGDYPCDFSGSEMSEF